jgi:hypothetical protein
MTAFQTIDTLSLENVTGGADSESWPGFAGRVIGCATNTTNVPDFGRCVMTGQIPKKPTK